MLDDEKPLMVHRLLLQEMKEKSESIMRKSSLLTAQLLMPRLVKEDKDTQTIFGGDTSK
jgi:hypothetical protein